MPERIAPRSFVEAIKAIDNSLDVEWSDKHQRWFITQVYQDGSLHYIYCVQDENNEYIDLDNRTLAEINRMFFKDSDCPDTVAFVEQQEELHRKEEERKLTDKISDANSYCRNLLVGAKSFGVNGFNKIGNLYVAR